MCAQWVLPELIFIHLHIIVLHIQVTIFIALSSLHMPREESVSLP